MNPDLERLLAALEAWLEATHDADVAKRRFDVLVDELLADKPGLDRKRFVLALKNRLDRIHHQQAKTPSTLPPIA